MADQIVTPCVTRLQLLHLINSKLALAARQILKYLGEVIVMKVSFDVINVMLLWILIQVIDRKEDRQKLRSRPWIRLALFNINCKLGKTNLLTWMQNGNRIIFHFGRNFPKGMFGYKNAFKLGCGRSFPFQFQRFFLCCCNLVLIWNSCMNFCCSFHAIYSHGNGLTKTTIFISKLAISNFIMIVPGGDKSRSNPSLNITTIKPMGAEHSRLRCHCGQQPLFHT